MWFWIIVLLLAGALAVSFYRDPDRTRETVHRTLSNPQQRWVVVLAFATLTTLRTCDVPRYSGSEVAEDEAKWHAYRSGEPYEPSFFAQLFDAERPTQITEPPATARSNAPFFRWLALSVILWGMVIVSGMSLRQRQETPSDDTPEVIPPLSAAERRALLLQAEDLKMKAISKIESEMRKDLDLLSERAGESSEEYRAREASFNSRLIRLREREPEQFLGEEDRKRLYA